MAKQKVNKEKLSIEDIMDKIIDNDKLKERKELIQSKNKQIDESNKKTNEKNVESKELKWFEKPMVKDFFMVKKHNEKYYARYKEWKDNVWIGGYNTKKDVESVIKSYVEETKKPSIDRNIQNIHSVILDI